MSVSVFVSVSVSVSASVDVSVRHFVWIFRIFWIIGFVTTFNILEMAHRFSDYLDAKRRRKDHRYDVSINYV